MADDLFSLLEPPVVACGLELVDVEHRAGVLLVTVDRPGGVDLDALTAANRAVSSVLDEHDPIPGRYSLEVSSPGVERALRTPAHFARAIGETVSVKTRPQVPGERRLTGTLAAADDEGFEVVSEALPGGRARLGYDEVDRVRTVFEWGPSSPGAGSTGPSTGRGATAGGKRSGSTARPPQSGQTNQKQTEQTRKQVTTP
ncbi:MAG: ribosome maturation factor RimP [Actinomycetota bacterium]|jgi:ribosome maturation factor RimP|nr:ribosome maturation factor RimP [Actinomycetota bacterium]MDA8293925.1 ribosome maturation factor RimP [Actinomycetota bacterium]